VVVVEELPAVPPTSPLHPRSAAVVEVRVKRSRRGNAVEDGGEMRIVDTT
jgi:hypothetical protein